jgi:hypothetical protein
VNTAPAGRRQAGTARDADHLTAFTFTSSSWTIVSRFEQRTDDSDGQNDMRPSRPEKRNGAEIRAVPLATHDFERVMWLLPA